MVIKPKMEQVESLVNSFDEVKEKTTSKENYYKSYLFPAHFLHIASPDKPMSMIDPLNSRITPVNSCVNTNNYGHWTSVWNNLYMNYVNPCTKNTTILNPATENYFIVEFPIIEGEHNTVWLQSGSGNWNVVSGWLLQPTSNIIARFLGSDVSSADASANTGRTLIGGPDGLATNTQRYHRWLGFNIHKDDVSGFKTSNNTVRVAFKPGNGHPYAYMHLSGIAATVNPSGVYWMHHLFFGSHTGWMHHYQNGVNKMGNYGVHYEAYMQQITTGATVTGLRIPVLDTTKDKIIGAVKYASNSDEGLKTYTLTGTGLVYIPKIEPHPLGRVGNHVVRNGAAATRYTIDEHFVVPKEVLQANVKTDATWGYKYLEFDIRVVNANTNYWHSFYTEDINEF